LTILTIDQALTKAESHKSRGELEDAKRLIEAVLQAFPKHVQARKDLASLKVLSEQGDLGVPPKYVTDRLLNVYKAGQLSSAVEEAQALVKDYPEALLIWNILGTAAAQLGMLEQARSAFNKVISLNPEYVDAYNNLGNVLNEVGEPDQAILSYEKAINIKPDYFTVYFNLGNLFNDLNQIDKAITAYKEALEIEPNFTEAYRNLAITLRAAKFTKSDPSLQRIIVKILDQVTLARPSDICSAAINLLKYDHKIVKYLNLTLNPLTDLDLQRMVSEFCEIHLFLKLMKVCPLPDVKIELLLATVRAKILLSLSSIKSTPELIKFQSALALQCFTNEYIYNRVDEREVEALAQLENSVESTIRTGLQPTSLQILCLASYKPLYQYEWSDHLLQNSKIKDVYVRQLHEPRVEYNLAKDIPKVSEITNSMSSIVKDQYEKNPYPRWVNCGLPVKPKSLREIFARSDLKTKDKEFELLENPDILIAGSGTGQHPIGVASTFKGSRVLAFDLSSASLSYALRKTTELGLNNIEYAQADILEIEKIGRKFDIVESVGVLHHMENPILGWKVLSNCLKPGGLMKIGLYSDLARQNIAKIRNEINEMKIGSCVTDMKKFRSFLMSSDYEHHKKIRNIGDFFNLSEFRDLLFHVQEHRFILPQIKELLAELNLTFCGFEQKEIVAKFKKIYCDKEDPYDLNKWHSFEKMYPNTFIGMYQFWCQKN
jgi:tetratricopeptide (TPR) repeat protein/2-polyprenyl-3-methyl-5-hydroxy-6-metoxy-1,4-benzoquinol methylase